jgi:hypothetical protein
MTEVASYAGGCAEMAMFGCGRCGDEKDARAMLGAGPRGILGGLEKAAQIRTQWSQRSLLPA